MAKKLKTPKFKNEADEVRWYEKNQDLLLAEFKDAAKDGTLGRGTLAKRGLTPTTTIRLDPVDIELAKTQAEQRGLRYQTYLKMLIHQALREGTPAEISRRKVPVRRQSPAGRKG